MSFPYKGVVFDWAWTLADLGAEDDRPAFSALWSQLNSMSFEIPPEGTLYEEYRTLFVEQIRSSRQSRQEACFEQVLGYLLMKYGIELTVSAREDLILTFYTTMYRQRRLYPDVVATLQSLKEQNVRMGIVSNTTNPGSMKRFECRKMGIAPYFDFGIYSSEVPFRKPHPSIFRLAVARMGFEPGEILYVGDQYQADVVGAKSVGMAVAWLNREKASQPQGPVPDFEISEIAEVLRLDPMMAQ